MRGRGKYWILVPQLGLYIVRNIIRTHSRAVSWHSGITLALKFCVHPTGFTVLAVLHLTTQLLICQDSGLLPIQPGPRIFTKGGYVRERVKPPNPYELPGNMGCVHCIPPQYTPAHLGLYQMRAKTNIWPPA